MNNMDIERCSREQDLGVLISSDLTWKKQVNSHSAKTNKVLGYARRATRFISSVRTIRTIYLTLIRAHLAYASPVLALQTVEIIKVIEKIQRHASKYMLGLQYLFSVQQVRKIDLC